jgi:hypothetical protein
MKCMKNGCQNIKQYDNWGGMSTVVKIKNNHVCVFDIYLIVYTAFYKFTDYKWDCLAIFIIFTDTVKK